MFYIELFFLGFIIVCTYVVARRFTISHEITPPRLDNNPSWDVIVTETTPTLSFFNSKGGARRSYIIEIDTSRDFDTEHILRFEINESGKFDSQLKIESKYALKDKTQYWWRVCGKSVHGEKSPWTVSRFFIDTTSDKQYSHLSRAQIKSVIVSSGYNAKNIIDYDDPGLTTFWQSPPPAPGDKDHWVIFDLGKPTYISRTWILSNPANSDGWLKDFIWSYSSDAKKWSDLPETHIKNNDTFRNIIDIPPTRARYFRLTVKEFIGYAAQINEVILFTSSKSILPVVPKEKYVLIIGNEHNGYTFTELAKHVESLGLGLKTVTIPYYNVSLNMINSLAHKPVAIILSGNNADYPNLPMFEFNGEFEIIRESNLPILGICAGHQFLSMAYGYTRARSMGWSDISAMEPINKMTHIKILKNDPLFEGIPAKFIAPEIHGWSVIESAKEFEIIAQSDYIQAQRSTRRLIYGVQFHAEIDTNYNEAKTVIRNFLKIVTKRSK